MGLNENNKVKLVGAKYVHLLAEPDNVFNKHILVNGGVGILNADEIQKAISTIEDTYGLDCNITVLEY